MYYILCGFINETPYIVKEKIEGAQERKRRFPLSGFKNLLSIMKNGKEDQGSITNLVTGDFSLSASLRRPSLL